MALKVLLFFPGIFLKIFRVFLVLQNNLCEPFSFYKGVFHKNPENLDMFSSKRNLVDLE